MEQKKKSLLKDIKDIFENLWDDLTAKKFYHRYHELEDRGRRVAGRLLIVGNLIAALVYLVWFFSVLNLKAWYISVPFFLAESIALVAFTIFAIIIWYPRYHNPEGVPPPEKDSTVDVFITTAGEPLSVLTLTVEAATRIDYPRKKVYVLDDASSPEVEALAKRLGCYYLTRPDHREAKAGNLNNALSRTDGEFILTLDADQVADPDIIQRTSGYFKFPYIAFVQSSQRFILPSGDPFGNSDDLFYRIMQTGKDTDNAAFSCGSGVMYRRAALESIGGFSTWNLVEDVHTSMRLHAKGWKSIYHNHPLSTGTAPTDIEGVYKQREQWAVDSFRLLFWSDLLKQQGLNLKQKIQYFQIGFAYFISGFVMPIYFIAPSWSLLTGQFLINAPAIDYVIYRGIYLLFTLAAIMTLQYPVDGRKPYKMWAGLFPIFIRATFKALRSRLKKPEYVVTRKTPYASPLWRRVIALWPQLSLIVLTTFSISYGLIFRTLSVDLFLINTAWGLWIIWSLSGICVATFNRKELPGAV